jgi:hypothetical protein
MYERFLYGSAIPDPFALSEAIHQEKRSRGMGGADNLTIDEIREIARSLPKIPGCTPTEQ